MIDSMLTVRAAMARFGLWFGGSLIVLAALVIGVDVTLRQLFNASVGGSDELARFALAIGSTWGMAGALVERFHIRVDSLYHRFPLWMQQLADLVSLLLLLFFFSLLTWHAHEMVMQSWRSGSISNSALQIPLVIPQGIWLVGLVMFLFSMLVTAITGVALMRKGRSDETRVLMGVKSADEELADELAEKPNGATDTEARIPPQGGHA